MMKKRVATATRLISKKAIRCLGVAESFTRRKNKSVLVGVVMRRDLIVDGVSLTTITVGGLDATEGIIRIYKGLNRDDINFMLINGAVIAFYNVIDLPRLYDELRVPIISITYNPSKGLEQNLLKMDQGENRLEIYRRNGPRERVYLKTGYPVFIRCFGLTKDEAVGLLNAFVISGRVPEPIRLANLMARAVLKGMLDD